MASDPPISSATKISLTVPQLLAVLGAFVTGAGSVGFIYGSLLPRMQTIEKTVVEIQKTQQLQAVTLARVTTLLEKH